MRLIDPERPAGRVTRNILAVLTVAFCATVWVVPPAQADPPPWAPAHGYRAKHKKHDRNVVYVAPFDIDIGRCNRELLGSILGGAAGGAIGSTIGEGDARTIAIIGGTIIGAIVGGSIGREMDRVDQNCVGQALEHAPDGRTVVWSGPEGGPRYQVTPLQTFRDEAGRYCREYRTQAVIHGRSQQLQGVACREPDGSWRLAR